MSIRKVEPISGISLYLALKGGNQQQQKRKKKKNAKVFEIKNLTGGFANERRKKDYNG